jgi:chorismate dehydratase
MDTLRISAVSYLNTYPFVYGLLQSGYLEDFRLDLDVPSACATSLATGQSDLALVPVGAIPDFTNPETVSDFCIGAVSNVRTVLLLSDRPLPDIRKITLDGDSRTSVQLVKVLAKNFWKIEPEWQDINAGLAGGEKRYESLVAIGDKTFGLAGKYRYVYDLAGEWIRFTSLPFVFAAWLSLQKMTDAVLDPFNRALEFGVTHIPDALGFFKDKLPHEEDCLSYLQKNISFSLDDKKKEGMKLFLELLGK